MMSAGVFMSLAKPVARSLAVSGLALLLMGCPYESSEPLTPLASSALDPRLTGAWRCLQSTEDQTWRVTFTPFDEHQYVVSLQEPPTEKEEFGLLHAYAGKLGEVSVLSLQELGPDKDGKPRDWSWLRYTLVDGDLLRLRFVSDKPLKPAKTPAEARALVEKQLASPDLYEEGFVCVGVPEPE